MNRYLKDDIYTATRAVSRQPLSRRFGTPGSRIPHRRTDRPRLRRRHRRNPRRDGGPVRTQARRYGAGEPPCGPCLRRTVRPAPTGLTRSRHPDAVWGVDAAEARPDGHGRPTEEHRRVHPGVVPSGTRPQPSRPRGHHRKLGLTAGPGPLRTVPPLPRDVLRPGRAAVGDALLAHGHRSGLDAVLVSAARVADAVTAGGLSPQAGADLVEARASVLETLMERLRQRAARAAYDDAPTFDDRLTNRLDTWQKYRAASSKQLVYDRPSPRLRPR